MKRKPGQTWLGASAIILLLGGGAAAYLHPHRGAVTLGRLLPGHGDLVSLSRFDWVPGRTAEYELSFRGEGRTNISSLQVEHLQQASHDSWQHLSSELKGKIVRTVLANEGGLAEVLYEVRIEKSETVANGRSVEAHDGTHEASVHTFHAQLTEKGQVSRLHFPKSMSPILRNQLRTILSLSQVVLADGPSQGLQWEVEETDLNGRYTVQYKTEMHQNEAREWHLSKRNYAALSEAGSSPIPNKQPAQGRRMQIEGGFQIGINLGSTDLSFVKGQRKSRVFLGDVLVGEDTNNLSLQWTGSRTLNPTELAGMKQSLMGWKSNSLASDLRGLDEFKIMREQQLRNIIGTSTVESLTAELTRSDATLKDLQDPYLKLKALLELDPNMAQKIGDVLTNLKSQSPSHTALATALSEVGSNACQDALRSAMQANMNDEDYVTHTIPYLGSTALPSQPSEDFLRDLAVSTPSRDLAATAFLSLGTMAHSLRQAGPSRSDRIFHEALAALQRSDSDLQRELFLSVIGNIGVQDQVPVMKDYLSRPESGLRERAAHALRFVPDAEARRLLFHTAETDRNEYVRERAVSALSFQSGTLEDLNRYEALLKSEKSLGVLKEILRNISTLASSEPEAKRILSDYAQRCGHPDLCPYVTGLVASLAPDNASSGMN